MRNSFERGSVENLDIDRMHEKAKRVIAAGRVLESDFVEPYGEDNIKSDIKRVETLEAQFEVKGVPQSKELKKVADIFEAVVLWHGEQSDWLGPNVVTIKTSKYDDYINGVDAIIEFQQTEPKSASYLGLATDVTFTADTTEKFDRLREQIERGELAKVKYFHSSHMNLHGQLTKLPEVIIGVERMMVLELGELWMERQNDVLAEHRIQIMILKQIREQLITFAMYAESLGKDDIANIYRERLAIIEEILSKKADLEKKVEFDIDDSVHFSIMSFMKSWQKRLKEKK